MEAAETFSHRYGQEVVKARALRDEVLASVSSDEIGMARGHASRINEAIRSRLASSGWALDPRVHTGFNLDVNAIKDRVGLTVQTGNVTRAFYDLLKFQVMHLHDRIDAAVLVVPTHGASRALGSNIANFNRVTKELGLFKHIITVPCWVLGIDEEGGGA
ncbi:MAG TPA: hypothetical protein DCX34_10420 [Roseovarius sp.]|nr:hypothetical protein [Roseovarius sp.]|tara:strand:- start:4847 stop:5326 length:480 start_codon:yes stop_codon:yes gene_type:complete